MKFLVSPCTDLKGQLKVAGDKSISHRSIILGSIAQGETRVRDLLEGEDVLATINAFRQMGVTISRQSDQPEHNNYQIKGVGLQGLRKPEQPLDMGNSGTAFRLLTGLLCAQSWESVMVGDESLSLRPMGRIIDPLTLMGAKIESEQGKPPLKITPSDVLQGISYATPMASAQVKSAVLLAGLYAKGTTCVSETAPTRDHTERMLKGFGYEVDSDHGRVCLNRGGVLKGQDIEIPADLSSAAFFILVTLISKNSELTLTKVGINPSRNGVLGILQRMGASIRLINQSDIGGEPVADIVVQSSNLDGVDIAGNDIALAIDEIPAIAVAAACATGVTRISDAKELRVKESDRISSVVKGLKSIGIDVIEQADGMIITGGEISGGTVDSYGDHRIAMAFAMAGVAANNPITVLNCKNVATSFPDFHKLANKIGVNLAIH